MGRVIIIGGGIAGVSTARALARRGREVLLLERDERLGQRSSAMSAGIFRLAVAERVNVDLAMRSEQIGRELRPEGFVSETGAFYPCADAARRAAILEASEHAGVVELGGARPGLVSPRDGVIDTDGLLAALAADARECGAVIRTRVEATSLPTTAGVVTGVVAGGETIEGEVVDCTGAWSPRLAHGVAMCIRPHRRHVFVLERPEKFDIRGIAWDLMEGIYLRPAADGILACPCDEAPFDAADTIPVDAAAEELLRAKLARFAPALKDAPVVKRWAGLRPLTPDGCFLVGPDWRTPGLFLVGGFGGHGMTAGPAAGELAAALLCGERPAEADAVDPARVR